MQDFAELIERLILTPQRNGKLRLIADHFRTTPDPDRGWALAALTGALDFRHAKPGLVRGLVEERVDPVLFRLSYDYVGDLSETVSLIWPAPEQETGGQEAIALPPSLSQVVTFLSETPRAQMPDLVAAMLDRLDETGRWAFLKLITGGLRIGVSARLAKTAVAMLANETSPDTDAIEDVWHGLEPPYESLFAWLEGHAGKPVSDNPAPFRPAMLAHPIEDDDFGKLDPADYAAEWKWDGIRVQAVCGTDRHGHVIRRLYSRTGEDISETFPDLLEALNFTGAIDGELLVVRQGRVQPFNDLQQRLNRKTVTKKLMDSHPAHLRAYDVLALEGDDLRGASFQDRRTELEALVGALSSPNIDLSPKVAFGDWDELGSARADPASHGAGDDADAVEGIMLKRHDSPYVSGRPKGPWFKWKRDPYTVDAVMMYAQRGHGKRSSFYSDYTFGVWRTGDEGEELVPVGKAYSGFTDVELKKLDKHVRQNTVDRFGPVRAVKADAESGLVLEIAFEGLNRSTRHKSGVAMRFPRIARIRWDKPPAEADRIEMLETLLPRSDS
ncbi:MAG: cisplatin damage response ATP-dependent DNA ligase [Pseudomonadota bacterium]